MLDHPFRPDAWNRDACDAMLADPDGRRRTCGLRKVEHEAEAIDAGGTPGCAGGVPVAAAEAERLRVGMLRLLSDGYGPGGGYYEPDQRLAAAVALLDIGWGKEQPPPGLPMKPDSPEEVQSKDLGPPAAGSPELRLEVRRTSFRFTQDYPDGKPRRLYLSLDGKDGDPKGFGKALGRTFSPGDRLTLIRTVDLDALRAVSQQPPAGPPSAVPAGTGEEKEGPKNLERAATPHECGDPVCEAVCVPFATSEEHNKECSCRVPSASAVPATQMGAAPQPCTGSGWLAVDRQGDYYTSTTAIDGECGICRQRVRIDSYGRCVTHPPTAGPPAVPALPSGARQQETEQQIKDLRAADAASPERRLGHLVDELHRLGVSLNVCLEAAAILTTALRSAEAARDARWREALGHATPWTVPAVLDKLADAADHLLDVHDCDAHGYELIQGSVKRARDYSLALRALLGSGATAPTEDKP